MRGGSGPRPPRLARWVLTRLVAKEEREYVLGDLQEDFERRIAQDRRAARGWYWRQLQLAIRRAESRSAATSGDRRAGRTRPGAVAWLLATTIQDVRYGIRSLRSSPMTTAIAAATLGLGIGAMIAIYALVDGILLRPLPFPDADRLIVVRQHYLDERMGDWNSSFPDYLDYQKRSASFEHLAAWQGNDPSLGADDGGPAIRVRAMGVTWNLLPALGVEPALGRGFLPEEDEVGAGAAVTILSNGLWRSRFGADPDILGSGIRLDGEPYTIVGVMPGDFTGAVGGNVLPPAPTDVWLPYRNSPAAEGMDLRGLRNVSVIGKLAAGVTLEQASADMSSIAAALAEQYPDVKTGEGVLLIRAHDAVVGWVRPILWILFGAVGLVLLIACTNVANLLLGRAATRRREIAVRMALGAGRIRLIRQMLGESVLLGGLGGAIAWGAAWAMVQANRTLVGLSLPRLGTVQMDARVFAFAVGVSVLAGLIFGLAPAIQSTSGGLPASLKSGDRTGTGGGGGRLLRQSLVVIELAMSMILLVGAGLLIRSFTEALRVDPGFEPRNVLTARVRLSMPFVDDEDWPRSVAFFDEAIERLAALPGVEAASAAYQLPTEGGWSNSFRIVGRPEPPRGEEPFAIFRPVSPRFFELAEIDLLRGRTFTRADHAEAPRVVIVNQAFVEKFFHDGEDPIGERLDYGNWWAGGAREYEIVGVVADVRFSGRTEDSFVATYFPHAQQPVREMSLMLRTRGDPLELAPALRGEIAAIDAELPVDDVATLEELLAQDEVLRRSMALLTGFFALSALLLAAIGVYGVMSFAVAQRTRELGIRLALGAPVGRLRGQVLRRGATVAAVGLVLGLGGAAALSGVIRGLLFSVRPADPMTLATVVGLLGTVALLACWLPARRATKVDPVVSLRAE